MSKTIAAMFGCNKYSQVSGVFMGLECEIESYRGLNNDLSDGWNITEDGSLRNEGREFVSPPLTREVLVQNFARLHSIYASYEKYPKFSERTSIHVHVNCQNIESDHVSNIIKLYALYEEMFFLLCEPSRRHNIHCVPLTETYLPACYKVGLASMLERWHKYTALNIKRLHDLGTIEFRHMEGHDDSVKLNNWLKCIENLVVLGKSPEGQITKTSLTNANLERWFATIFGHTPEYTKYVPLLRDITAHQRIDLKLAVM